MAHTAEVVIIGGGSAGSPSELSRVAEVARAVREAISFAWRPRLSILGRIGGSALTNRRRDDIFKRSEARGRGIRGRDRVVQGCESARRCDHPVVVFPRDGSGARSCGHRGGAG